MTLTFCRSLALGCSLLFSGCSGEKTEAPAPAAAAASTVSTALVDATWQARFANDQARAPFEGRPSWVARFGARNREALGLFVSENDKEGGARAHVELSATYREAVRLAANAAMQVYGVDAEGTDPAEVAYLLGVSGALLGDATWRARLGESSGSTVKALAAQDQAWKAWMDAGATWPPDGPAGTSPGAPGDPTAGQTPDAGPLPPYQLPERIADGTKVDAGDTGTLWALARYHETAARALSPENGPILDAILDPWRLPPEPKSGGPTIPVPDTFLFMSYVTSAGDLAFMADLARDGAAALATHQADSAYAVAIQHCASGQKLSVDCVLDESAGLAAAIEAAMAKVAGKEESFHRAFADYARVGLVRAADRVAFAMGDSDAGGRLRINALDRSGNNTRDPLFLLSVAAWDAGNRNSLRAADLVHTLLSEVPGLEAARLPLDALHIRLSRNAAPGRPMH